MKQTAFKWYRMVGVSYTDVSLSMVDTVFLYLVQASSKRAVIKHYGGRRALFTDGEPAKTLVYFPAKEQEVEAMPEGWLPGPTDAAANMPGVVVKVVPVTRYECTHCGTIRYSEYPYPSMWCSCSHKAYPNVAPATPPDAPVGMPPVAPDAEPGLARLPANTLPRP